MSSERYGGRVSFACDTCPETIDTDEGDFKAALGEAKAAGWSAYNVSGEWCHACPACREDRR